MSSVSAFWIKTRFQFRNAVRLGLRQSRFKLAFILLFALFFELFLTLVFRDSFRFLNSFGGAGVMMIGRLFSLFFLGLGLMLFVSGIVTSYSALYASEEIPFLRVRPFTMSSIVTAKFIQAAGFSSWAYCFIVLPFIAAYVWYQHMSPWLVIWALLFSIPFLFLFTGMGTLVVLLCVRFLPQAATSRRAIVLGAVALVLGLLVASARPVPEWQETRFNIATLIPGLRLAGHPLSPSHWMSEGMTALSRGNVARGLRYLAALTTHALLIGCLIERVGAWTYEESWQRSYGAPSPRRRAVLLGGLRVLRRWLPSDIAAMIIKDIRVFFRDPAQWSQALVFFGLLALYFSNLRTFNYHTLPEAWRSTIIFLNVFAVSAVLSSLGSRFVYPQLSLEGHGFWMLGLSPASFSRMMAAKFLLAFATLGTVSVALIGLSVRLLDSGTALSLAAVGIIAAVALTVCGLSTGLGAVFMDLDQRNPAAIVSSFGGTLNIVLCLSYLFAVIFPFGVLFHLRELGMLAPRAVVLGMLAATAWLVVLTVLACGLPLWLGLRSLQHRDY